MSAKSFEELAAGDILLYQGVPAIRGWLPTRFSVLPLKGDYKDLTILDPLQADMKLVPYATISELDHLIIGSRVVTNGNGVFSEAVEVYEKILYGENTYWRRSTDRARLKSADVALLGVTVASLDAGLVLRVVGAVQRQKGKYTALAEVIGGTYRGGKVLVTLEPDAALVDEFEERVQKSVEP